MPQVLFKLSLFGSGFQHRSAFYKAVIMSSRNPNSKRSPLLEMMDEMEKDNQLKKDANLAIIESANKNFSERHPFIFGILMAAIGAIFGALVSCIL